MQYLAYQSVIDNRTADAPKKLKQCFNLTDSNWEGENKKMIHEFKLQS